MKISRFQTAGLEIVICLTTSSPQRRPHDVDSKRSSSKRRINLAFEHPQKMYFGSCVWIRSCSFSLPDALYACKEVPYSIHCATEEFLKKLINLWNI